MIRETLWLIILSNQDVSFMETIMTLPVISRSPLVLILLYLSVTSLLLSVTSGCTDTTSTMSNITIETPHIALTNLTETIKCMGKAIEQSDSPAILLLVDDFYDGTVPIITDSKALVISSMRQNGPLADAGKYDFEAIIKRSVSGKKIIIPYSLPIGLVKENLFGRLDQKYLLGLAKMYKASGIIRVKGVFTQNDSSEYYSKGVGTNNGVDGKHGEAEIEYGAVQGSKSISLVVHLGNAMNNTLAGATTLTLNTHSKKDEFSIGFGYGEGGMSFTKETKIEEGLHGAQRTLVEAAAMWILRGLYKKVNFSQCLADQGPAPQITISAYQKWLEFDSQTGIKYLKLMLRELKYYSGKVNSNYDRQLQKAVASYEADNDLIIPHTQNNLGDLFILLYPKVDFEKIQNQLQKIMDFDSEPAEQRGRLHSLKQKKWEKPLPVKTTKKIDSGSAEQRGRLHSLRQKKRKKSLPVKTTKDMVSNTSSLVCKDIPPCLLGRSTSMRSPWMAGIFTFSSAYSRSGHQHIAIPFKSSVPYHPSLFLKSRQRRVEEKRE
ncbi:hypothetical protein VU04_03695 [Desulfobulbus sp. TB]|nr:hypothetical protein [Desulfobulbus sp. TB]